MDDNSKTLLNKILLNNPNVEFCERDEELCITVQPYDREISVEYANFILEEIKWFKNDILEYFQKDTFVLSISDHNIDGLYETNSLLLFNNSHAYSNY